MFNYCFSQTIFLLFVIDILVILNYFQMLLLQTDTNGLGLIVNVANPNNNIYFVSSIREEEYDKKRPSLRDDRLDW